MLMRTSCLLLFYALCSGCGARNTIISTNAILKPRVSFQCISFEVELARTFTEQEKGLMFRTFMPKNTGMLFIFDNQIIRYFWMKNTLIALDMIFMDSQKKIVGIVANSTPQTLDLRGPNKPSQYVLEINAGEAQKYGLQIGMQGSW